MSSVLIIYGTTGGNTQLVCEKVAEVLETKGLQVHLQRVEQSKTTDIEKADVAILAAPTYGHGVMQEYFVPFLKEMKKRDFKGQKFLVIGLGEPKYELLYHIESAKILEEAVKKSNGQLLGPSLRISGQPVWHLNGLIKVWAEKTADLIQQA